MVAESLNIPSTLVLRILKEGFVPQSLTLEQRENRVTSWQDNIATADANINFFNNRFTGDETWCFDYDPETKRQCSKWVSEISPRPKKLKF